MNELTNAEEYSQIVNENMDSIFKEEREFTDKYAEAIPCAICKFEDRQRDIVYSSWGYVHQECLEDADLKIVETSQSKLDQELNK